MVQVSSARMIGAPRNEPTSGSAPSEGREGRAGPDEPLLLMPAAVRPRLTRVMERWQRAVGAQLLATKDLER